MNGQSAYELYVSLVLQQRMHFEAGCNVHVWVGALCTWQVHSSEEKPETSFPILHTHVCSLQWETALNEGRAYCQPIVSLRAAFNQRHRFNDPWTGGGRGYLGALGRLALWCPLVPQSFFFNWRDTKNVFIYLNNFLQNSSNFINY